MSLLDRKEIAIDLEKFNINSTYLVRVLQEVNLANPNELVPDIHSSYNKLFADTQESLNCLKAKFIKQIDKLPTPDVA